MIFEVSDINSLICDRGETCFTNCLQQRQLHWPANLLHHIHLYTRSFPIQSTQQQYNMNQVAAADCVKQHRVDSITAVNLRRTICSNIRRTLNDTRVLLCKRQTYRRSDNYTPCKQKDHLEM